VLLTEANVLHYLVKRGFARYDTVTDGSFAVRNLSRRNRNFRVCTGSRDLLVKQAGEWNQGGRATIEREAALCRRAHTDAALESLRRLLPTNHSYDPRNSILIFDFLASTTVAGPEHGAMIGAVMAEFHRAMSASELAEAFPADPPGVLFLHRWPDLVAGSDGQRELLKLLRRHEGFASALDGLSGSWCASALVHNDWKAENCLVGDAGFHVVDWEMAGWGDPLWDAATFVQSVWNRWVRDPDEFELDKMRPGLVAFLDTYGAPIDEVMAFAGARMLQSAWEALQLSTQMEGDVVRLAQASLNILTRPEWAREELLRR
jgi:hypothetical protein